MSDDHFDNLHASPCLEFYLGDFCGQPAQYNGKCAYHAELVARDLAADAYHSTHSVCCPMDGTCPCEDRWEEFLEEV